MNQFVYEPKGTCSYKMTFTISDDNTLIDFQVLGGCSGNLQAVRKLILNKNIDYIIDTLGGIKCGNKQTSCGDQIAQGLKQYKESFKNE